MDNQYDPSTHITGSQNSPQIKIYTFSKLETKSPSPFNEGRNSPPPPQGAFYTN